MKYLVSLILALSTFIDCTPPPLATDADLKTENIIQVPLTKQDIYNKTLQWMAITFVSSKHVIELQDSTQGVIIGNGSTTVHSTFLGDFDARFTMRIDIKDNKFCFSSTNYQLFYNSIQQEGGMRKDLADQMRGKINDIQQSLFNYLGTTTKPKDF